MLKLFAQTYVDLAASRPDVPSLFSTPDQIVATIFNFISLIAGVVFVCLILFAGITYLLGAGDDNQTGKAKKMLTTAVVGLFITLSAWAGGGFILDKLFGRSQMSRPPTPSPTATQVENLNTTVTINADGTPAGITLFVLPHGSSATTLAELQAAKLASGTAGVDGQIPLNFNYTVTSDPQMFRVVLLRDNQRVDTSYTDLGLEGATINWLFPSDDQQIAGQETITTQFAVSPQSGGLPSGLKVYVLPEDSPATSEAAAEAVKLGSGVVVNGQTTITFSFTPNEAGVTRFRVVAIAGSRASGELFTATQLRLGAVTIIWD